MNAPLVWTAVERDSTLTPIEIGICVTQSVPSDGKFLILGMAGYPLAEKQYEDLLFDDEDMQLYEDSNLLPILRQHIGFYLSRVDKEMVDIVGRYDSGEGLRYAGREGNWNEMEYLLPQMDSLIKLPPLDLDGFSEIVSLAGLSDEIEPRLKTPRAGRAVQNAQLDLFELEYYVKILHAIPLEEE